MTIAERYADACNADDLSQHEYLSPVDALTASGMASAKTHKGKLATQIWRLIYANDPTQFGPALHGLHHEMILEAKAKRWNGFDPETAMDVCRNVLMWHIADVCPSCCGRRYEVVAGTPMLSDTVCNACKGSGVVAIDVRLLGYQPVWKERARWLRSHIALLLDDHAGKMMKRLRREFDNL